MAEFKEPIKADSKLQNEVSQTIEMYNNESYATQSKQAQNVLIQSKVFEQATNKWVILLKTWMWK